MCHSIKILFLLLSLNTPLVAWADPGAVEFLRKRGVTSGELVDLARGLGAVESEIFKMGVEHDVAFEQLKDLSSFSRRWKRHPETSEAGFRLVPEDVRTLIAKYPAYGAGMVDYVISQWTPRHSVAWGLAGSYVNANERRPAVILETLEFLGSLSRTEAHHMRYLMSSQNVNDLPALRLRREALPHAIERVRFLNEPYGSNIRIDINPFGGGMTFEEGMTITEELKDFHRAESRILQKVRSVSGESGVGRVIRVLKQAENLAGVLALEFLIVEKNVDHESAWREAIKMQSKAGVEALKWFAEGYLEEFSQTSKRSEVIKALQPLRNPASVESIKGFQGEYSERLARVRAIVKSELTSFGRLCYNLAAII